MSEPISRIDLVRVLRAHDVFVEETEGGTFNLVKGDFAECQVLGKDIRPKQIRYFWRKLGIPIHHFWHPEEAESQAKRKLKVKRDNETAS